MLDSSHSFASSQSVGRSLDLPASYPPDQFDDPVNGSDQPIQPFRRESWSNKCFWFITRWPSLCACFSMLPSIIAILLLVFPSWTIELDLTYGQFVLDGDTDGKNENAFEALSAYTYSRAPPSLTTTLSQSSQEIAYQTKLNEWESYWRDLSPTASASLTRQRYYSHTNMTTPLHHAFQQLSSTNLQPMYSQFDLMSSTVTETDLPPPKLHTQNVGGGSRSQLGETLVVLYSATDDSNLLTNDRVAIIHDIEQAIQNAPGYRQYCRLYSDTGTCYQPSSIINFMYPSVQNGQITFDGRGTEVDVEPATVLLLQSQRTGFFSRTTTVQNPTSSTLIATFQFGIPLDGHDWSDLKGQREEIRAFLGSLEDLFQSVDNKNGFRVLREGGDLFAVEIRRTLYKDAITICFSIVVIFLYMWYHTSSFFLTIASIFHMAMSFPPIILWYKYVFGDLMQVMNIVALWLILGIGADDVFVFADTWAQHRLAKKKSNNLDELADQLAWTWRKSCAAMLVTSLTTAAGFYSTAISRLLPLREFGFFLGGVVVVNYLFMITYFPAIVVLHQKYQVHCCRAIRSKICKKKVNASSPAWQPLARNPNQIQIEMDSIDPSATPHSNRRRPVTAVLPGQNPDDSLLGEGHLSPSDEPQSPSSPPSPPPTTCCGSGESFMIRFSLVLYRIRWIILLLTIGGIVALSIQIPKLRPPTDLPQLLATDSNIELLRKAKKDLQCDNCWLGLPDPTNSGGGGSGIPTCPITVCGDPGKLKLCEGILCNNGGTCKSGICYCASGWMGSRCDDVNYCLNYNCNHGTCSSYSGSAHCSCYSGWQGSTCSVPIPPASSSSSSSTAGRISSSSSTGSLKSSSSSTGASKPSSSSSSATPTASSSSTAIAPVFPSSSSSTGTTTASSSSAEPVASSSSSSVPSSSSSSSSLPSSSTADPSITSSSSSGPSGDVSSSAAAPTASSSTGGAVSSSSSSASPASSSAVPSSSSADSSSGSVSSSSSAAASSSSISSSSTGTTTISSSSTGSSVPSSSSSSAGVSSSTAPTPSSSSSSAGGPSSSSSDASSSSGPTPSSSSSSAVASSSSAADASTAPSSSSSSNLPSSSSIPSLGPSSSTATEPSSSTGSISSSSSTGASPSSSSPSSSAASSSAVSSSSSSATPTASSSSSQPSSSSAPPTAPSSSSSTGQPPSSSSSISSSSTGGSSSSSTGVIASSSSSTGGVAPPAPIPPKPISPDLSLRLQFVWGVSSVDMSAADSDNKGVPEFDPTFDLSDPAAQTFLADTCVQLLNRTDVRDSQYSRCIMSAFRTWAGNSFPVTDIVSSMIRFLQNGGGGIYGSDVGFQLKSASTNSVAQSLSFHDHPITLASASSYRISFILGTVLTYIDKDQGGLQLQPFYNQWDDWMTDVNSRAPPSATNGFQCSSVWSRMRVELAFISGTIKSIILSVATVAITILIFTHNAWLMLFTVVCIIAIVACLLGLFVLWGWSLGAMEAISVPLVVGLSVDYCLHLGHAYNHAGETDPSDPTHKPKSDRFSRMQSSLISIGPSVVSAAVTTIGSMFVLIWCDIYVFKEIGIIVSCTLLLGIYFSMCVFSILCMLWGPEHDDGNILVWFKRCWRCCKRVNEPHANRSERMMDPSPELEYSRARLD